MHPYLDACAGLLEEDWSRLQEQNKLPSSADFPKEVISRMFGERREIKEFNKDVQQKSTSQVSL
jgi:hypothetical protein